MFTWIVDSTASLVREHFRIHVKENGSNPNISCGCEIKMAANHDIRQLGVRVFAS